MPNSLHTNITERRFRVAQIATIAGALSVGTIVVSELVEALRGNFELYYGITSSEVAHAEQVASAQLPVTVGQLLVAAVLLVTVLAFVASERFRLRRERELVEHCEHRDVDESGCRRIQRKLVAEPIRGAALFDEFILRTSRFAFVLLSIRLLQISLERKLSGLGWGIEYADWQSLLPLASVFGICVIAGMLVAAVSLVGLRAIYVLEHSFRMLWIRPRRAYGRLVVRRHCTDVPRRTLRSFIGCVIYSRPPPGLATA